MAEYNCTYRKALMIYVPPKENRPSDDKPKDDYRRVNVPDLSVHDDSLFPKLPTPRNVPLFSGLTVETEADIHYEVDPPKFTPRPKKQPRRRRVEDNFDLDYQWTTGDDQTENDEKEKKESRDSGKLSELLIRLKEILFLRRLSFQAKVNSMIKVCAEWLISLVAGYIPDWPIIKVVSDYLMNNG